MNLSNQLLLKASVAELSTLRYTPAGIAAINLVLEHRSELHSEKAFLVSAAAKPSQPSPPRQVHLVIKAVAFGALAEQAAFLPMAIQGGDLQSRAISYQFSGFLAHVRGGKGLVFHLQTIDLLPDAA